MNRIKFFILLLLIPFFNVNAVTCSRAEDLEAAVSNGINVKASNNYYTFDLISEEYIDFDFSSYDDISNVYISDGKLHYNHFSECAFDIDVSVNYKNITINKFYSILNDVKNRYNLISKD